MAELSIPYELEGPDGTVMVTGNSDEARADPNWVGYLTPDQGITGLDGPDVRVSAADIVEGHGGIHYDAFHGRRPVTMNGQIWPVEEPEEVNLADQRIRRATNAMRADEPAILRWQNTGFPMRRLLLQRQQPPRITGRRPKDFLITMESADYRILSDAEHESAATAFNTDLEVTNAGDELATARWVIDGPIQFAPIRLRHMATGLEIQLKEDFGVGGFEQLVIDTAPPYPIVQLNGVDRYDVIDYQETTWWGLLPGPQDVRVVTENVSDSGTFQLLHRDSWI